MAKSVQAGGVPGDNESREESELIVALDESDFKPRLYKHACQYCGYINGRKRNVDNHINSQHEMTIWYQCKYCKHACAETKTMQLHIKRQQQTSCT